MNKKLFYAMSRRRVSCPQSTQQLWDAIKTIRYQRQVPDIERISRYMMRMHNVSHEEVVRQLGYCVRDGLLEQVKRIGFKGSKIGIEQEGYKLPHEKIKKDSHDWYCFECHRGGDVISCNSCHRVYHLACIAKEELPETDVKHKFKCNVCKMCEAAKEENLDIKKSQLNRLLTFTCNHLKQRMPGSITERPVVPMQTPYVTDRLTAARRPSSEVPSNIKWVSDDKDDWRQEYLIYRYMDLPMMESKAEAGKYEHLEQFKADAQTIVHNVVILHGVHSVMADQARLMLRDCIYDLQEIRQCRDCYRVSNEKTNKHWFCKPCRPPHMLVYAKQKGFPYWPAKVIKIEGEQYDVRFFGGQHQRALVEKSYIRPISVNIHTLQVKRTSSWNKACEELKRHQDLLEKMRVATNNFTTPPPDSSSSESEIDSDEEDDPEDRQPEQEGDTVDDQDEDDDEDEDDDDDEEQGSSVVIKQIDKTTPPVVSVKTTPPVVACVVKRKVGRPPKIPSHITEVTEPKVTNAKPNKIIKPIKIPGKRGRPRLNSLPVTNNKLPAAAIVATDSATTPKRRGRPPGSKNKRPSKAEMERRIPIDDDDDEDEDESKVNETSSNIVEQIKEVPEGAVEEVVPETDSAVTVASVNVASVAGVDSVAVEEEEEEEDDDDDELGPPQLQHGPSSKKESPISSTTLSPPLLVKKEEEEMVSSSSQEPRVRTVGIQVKLQDKRSQEKPSKELINRIKAELEFEKQRDIGREVERLKTEHAAEISLLREKHSLQIADTKKKQWCYNCEREAIYHCCWNTAYCSTECQQLHWQKEHKRVCRRKR
ncbi:zinc finger MYND domain-containing protein 11 [Lycorma delicatula]|uniref:zinc finger MYND domain-containing protein 11 n=1 Tax=Lycorma delicatula TaxID=130591 RepID=UPI003F518497